MSDRYVCTKESPWNPDKGPRAAHSDAETTYEGWESSSYKCPHCGATWTVYDDDIR